jgi:hypothetical protein
MTDHPMTPPLELLVQWESDCLHGRETAYVLLKNAYVAGAQAGADMELEACCKVICNSATNFSAAALLEAQRGSDNLRTARRPKPPSLKEQGLGALKLLKQRTTDPNIIEPLTRALEALPE